MKKQSLSILLSVILSACTSSQRPAPIEYNNSRSNKAAAKTNPTIVDEGEVISTGAVEVRDNEIINPDDNINESNYTGPTQNSMTTKTKVIYHEVQVGETIEEVAGRYGVKITEIAALNDLTSPYHLEEFQVLKIKQVGDQSLTNDSAIMPDSKEFEQPLEQPLGQSKSAKGEKFIDKPHGKSSNRPVVILEKKETSEFIMPIKGKILAKFGDKTDLGLSKGISISAKTGAEVRAAASGKVIYADYDATYGNLVIIKLNGKNIVTSYAHLGDIVKHKGTDVKQGELIGHIGSSGKVKEPQLNFGIREGKIAKDPAKFLKY